MPGACRLGDQSKAPLDAHGCPACPHPNVIGPAVAASGNVFINGMPGLRVGDPGIHAACCNTNTWKVVQGSGSVFLNGAALVRAGDQTKHCGGIGKMVTASGNVVDGSAASESMKELQESVSEWLERVQEGGIAELLRMIDPGLGAAYYGPGELGKLTDPDCQGLDYLKHLAKCLPSKPPGWDDRDGPPPQHPVPVRPRVPYDPPIQPVGFWDPTNPITAPLLIAAGGVGEGGELLGVGGKWAIEGGGKLLGGAADGLGDGLSFVTGGIL